MDRDYFQPTDSVERRITVARVLMFALIAVFALNLLWEFVLFSGKTNGAALLRLFALQPLLVVTRFHLWQLFTYAFLERNVLSLVFDALTLWFFGNMIEDFVGRRKFAALWGGAVLLTGIAFTILGYLQFPGTSLIGPDGAFLAIIVAAALQWPDQSVIFFFFPIRLKWLAIILVAMNAANGVQTLGPAWPIYFSNLAGAAWGFLFWKYQGRIGEMLERWDEAAAVRAEKQAEATERGNAEEIDRILAKIAREGLPSLTSAERGALDRESRRKRNP